MGRNKWPLTLRAARAEGIRVFATDQLNFRYHPDSDPSNDTYVQTDEYFLSQGTVMWDGQRFDRVGIKPELFTGRRSDVRMGV